MKTSNHPSGGWGKLFRAAMNNKKCKRVPDKKPLKERPNFKKGERVLVELSFTTPFEAIYCSRHEKNPNRHMVKFIWGGTLDFARTHQLKKVEIFKGTAEEIYQEALKNEFS